MSKSIYQPLPAAHYWSHIIPKFTKSTHAYLFRMTVNNATLLHRSHGGISGKSTFSSLKWYAIHARQTSFLLCCSSRKGNKQSQSLHVWLHRKLARGDDVVNLKMHGPVPLLTQHHYVTSWNWRTAGAKFYQMLDFDYIVILPLFHTFFI